MKQRLFLLIIFSFYGLSVFSQTPVITDPKLDPRSVRNQDFRFVFNQGLEFFFKKSYDLSVLYFLQALKQDSNHFWSRYFLGLAFYKLGQNDEAIREWENLIRLGQENQALREKLVRLYKDKDTSDRRKLEGVYVWVENYPHSGQLKKMGIPIELGISLQNELMVLDFSSGQFFKIDNRGNLVDRKFDLNGKLDLLRPLKKPWDFYQLENQYWISDFGGDRVIKFDFDSFEVLQSIGSKGRGPLQFIGPKGIDGDEYGNFFVVDSGNSRIQYINREGKWLRSFGDRGRDLGDFLNPDDLLYHPKRKTLFVSDKGNKWVTEYNIQGEALQVIGQGVLQEPSKLFLKDQELFILDRSEIYLLNLENQNQALAKLELKKEFANEKNPYTSITMGKNHYLYLGNAIKRKIEVFAPIEYTYVNWGVQLENLNLEDFPTVKLEVSVRDPLRNPIRGLKNDDFVVYENRVPVFHHLVASPVARRLVLLVEETDAAKKKQNLLGTLINEFFDGLALKDRLKVITFNDRGYEEKTIFTPFRLVTIDRTLSGSSTPGYLISRAFRKGVSDLRNNHFDNALILVMFSPLTVEKREGVEFEILLNLARNNQLPVYVFYLGSGDRGVEDNPNFNYLAKKMAQTTGGKYYTYDLRTVKQFYRDHQNFDHGLYRLYYNSTPNQRLSSFSRKVKVVVKHKKNLGEDGLMLYPIP